jgi:nucleoside-diphosphate-sugar epimerase
MQTILGSNGQIGEELARELKRHYTSEIRLVSRNPKKVNDTDAVFAADLMDLEQSKEAVKGSDIVYLTLGLPLDTKLWVEHFPIIMRNVIAACKTHKAKLVYFDNTYMYPQNSLTLTEETAFEPLGPKGMVRAEIASMLLEKIKLNHIEAVLCRAPEFYGPAKTQGFTNALIINKIRKEKKLRVILSDSNLRTLIWTPDASRATALIGNTPDAYNQTWHLPVDNNRLTSKQFITLAEHVFDKKFHFSVLSIRTFKIGGLFVKALKEIQELLPRYTQDNIFVSTKFEKRFPEFRITSYQEGLQCLRDEQKGN